MKVIVCGGRDYDDQRRAYEVLDQQMPTISLVIEGGARGADTLARMWADLRRVDCLTVPANWDRDGFSAGPRRNTRMLTYSPDLVIALPGGRGTANMIGQARKAGVKVIEVE